MADDFDPDAYLASPPTLNVRAMSYGPIQGEYNRAAMVGPNKNPLQPYDIAASPDLESAGYGQGDWVMVNGQLHRIADASYRAPGVPNRNSIELRDQPDLGRATVTPAPFDPDAYLGEKTAPAKAAAKPATFDPDSYLSGKTPAPAASTPTYAPQVVTPDQAVPDTSDEERDQLFYKTGKTKSEREALNKPLREAMQVPAVSPETVAKGLQAVSSIGATGPEDLQQAPVEKAIQGELAKAISGMTSGEGVSSLPLYAFPPTAVGLTAEPATELPSQVSEAIQKYREGDYPGAATAGTRAALNAAMLAGVVHGGAEIMGPRPASVADAIRAQPEPPPVQPGTIPTETARVADAIRQQEPTLAQKITAPPPAPEPEIITPELGDPFHPPVIPPEDVRYAGGEQPAITPSTTEPTAEAPAGTSNRIFEQTYGEGGVPGGIGVDTGALLDKARADIGSGVTDPYSILSRTRQSGIANPQEYATLAAEHERLVNDAVAKEKAGDPVAAEAAQRANDFANAIQPHKTAASDLMRLFQGDLNYDLGTTFGMDQYMKSELGRGIKPGEAPKFNRMAEDIRNGETEAQQSVVRSDARVQNHYARVRDIPIEEAAARVKAQLGDCLV